MNANNKSVEKDVQEFELDTGVELTSCVVLLVALSSLPLACTTTTSTTTTKTTPPEDAGVAGEEPGGATASPVDDSEEAPDSGSSKIS